MPPNNIASIGIGGGTTPSTKNVQDKVSELERKIKGLNKQIENQRIKIVEFLGIFTAILSFVTISGKVIIDNLSLIEIMVLLPGFGITLLMFVVTIDLLVKKNDKSTFFITFGLFILMFLVSLILTLVI